MNEGFKSVKMDTKIIEVIFRFGHILSLTPQSVKLNRKFTYFQKFCNLLMFILLTISLNFYFFRIKLVSTQRILTNLMLIIFAMHDFYILIIVKFHKQFQWFHLIKYLQYTQCHKNKFKLYYLQFVITQSIEVILILVGVCIYFILFGVGNMIAIILISTELYLQSFYLVLRCIVLEMLWSRYQYQKLVLLKVKPEKVLIQYFLKVLVKTHHNLFILKETVDVFNDIFGWTTLMSIFSTSIRTLHLLDVFIRNDGPFQVSNSTGTMLSILYQIIIFLKSWV
jgi:hypothetical protein